MWIHVRGVGVCKECWNMLEMWIHVRGAGICYDWGTF